MFLMLNMEFIRGTEILHIEQGKNMQIANFRLNIFKK